MTNQEAIDILKRAYLPVQDYTAVIIATGKAVEALERAIDEDKEKEDANV